MRKSAVDCAAAKGSRFAMHTACGSQMQREVMMHWVGRSARVNLGWDREMDMAAYPPKDPGPWKVPQGVWLSTWDWSHRAQIHKDNVYKGRVCFQESVLW